MRVDVMMINLALPSTEPCSVKICLCHGSEPVWDQYLFSLPLTWPVSRLDLSGSLSPCMELHRVQKPMR